MRRMRPIRPSVADERAYRDDLRVLVGALKVIAREYVLPALRSEFPGALVTDAAPSPRVQQIVGEVATRFGRVDEQAYRMAKLAARRSLGTVDEKLARECLDSVGVNIEQYLHADGKIAHVMGEKVMDNVALIKTIPEQYFFGLRDAKGVVVRRGVVDAVADHWKTGGRWETLVEDIEAIGGVTEGRAKVIARDQTAKMNAAFNQSRQEFAGVEDYEWSATRDGRTRADHWALHGTRHKWSAPGPLEGTIDGEPCHPGEDVLCRCDAISIFNLEAMERALGLAPMRREDVERWIS